MSADLMIICKEDDSHFEGNGSDKAFCIGESSMGDPNNDFAQWFIMRYSQERPLMERLMSEEKNDHEFRMIFTQADFKACEQATLDYELSRGVNREELLEYLSKHIGKHLSVEPW